MSTHKRVQTQMHGDVESLKILSFREEVNAILHSKYIGCFFFFLIDKRCTNDLLSFIGLSVGYNHCDLWSSFRHRLLNLPEM
jgi:hypothetical protein